MKKILIILTAMFVYTGCTTMPGPVQERYLKEKTAGQTEKLNSLEKQIIEKNREKQQTENRLKTSMPAADITKEEVKLLEKEKDILKDQLELYTKSKDAVNMELKKEQIAETEKKLEKKKTLLKFQNAEKDFLHADNNLKKAQLAELIAELNYEKSRIAEAYREKTEPDTGKGEGGIMSFFKRTDPNDRFGYKKYSKYFEKTKKELAEAEKKFSDAEKNLEKARKDLEAIK